VPLVDGLLVVVLVVLLGLIALGLRRVALRRGGGTIDLSLRLRRRARGRGWALGVGRYDGEHLLWYRVFSFAPRPRRTLPRGQLVVVGQRRPSGPEALALLSGSVILECRGPDGGVELAVGSDALPGFLAWLEATPGRGPQIS
jgi:hypothetical protein